MDGAVVVESAVGASHHHISRMIKKWQPPACCIVLRVQPEDEPSEASPATLSSSESEPDAELHFFLASPSEPEDVESPAADTEPTTDGSLTTAAAEPSVDDVLCKQLPPMLS